MTDPKQRVITPKVLTRALILCNNEDKAAKRMIMLKPRVQAEILQAVRKNKMKPEDFILKFGEKGSDEHRNAIFRLANVSMVIAGAAGYIQQPKSWLPAKAQDGQSSSMSSNDDTVVTPESVKIALTYMGGNTMTEANEMKLIRSVQGRRYYFFLIFLTFFNFLFLFFRLFSFFKLFLFFL